MFNHFDRGQSAVRRGTPALLQSSRRLVLVLSVIVALLGSTFVAGHVSGTYNLLPILQKVEKRLVSLVRPAEPLQANLRFESIFLWLTGEAVTVPVERAGRGGGLTSVGDRVLLLTHEGRIFAARSPNDVVETDIVPPDNGFAAYRNELGAHYDGDVDDALGRLRYNDILYVESAAERGLVISYTEYDDAQKCFGTTIARLDMDSPDIDALVASPDDWTIVYRTQPCLPLVTTNGWQAIAGHTAGGRIAFSPPERIYLASGDYGLSLNGLRPNVYSVLAQEPDNDYGKVVEIDLASGNATRVSMGHRNPQGIVLDREGSVWLVEHGLRGGDELNRIVPGANFGWPMETLGTLYTSLPVPTARSYGRHDAFEAPTYAWLPAIAVSNVTRIEGFHESWDGDLLASSLKDQSLYRLHLEQDRVLFAERIPIGHRIRYAHQHSDGRIVLWTDDRLLIFLKMSDNDFAAGFVDEFFETAAYGEAEEAKVRAAFGRCIECHSFQPGSHAGAPSLASIFGADIASTPYDNYSDALRERDGAWTRENLAAFILDPQAFAPGTAMPDPGVEGESLNKLIDLLEAMATTFE